MTAPVLLHRLKISYLNCETHVVLGPMSAAPARPAPAVGGARTKPPSRSAIDGTPGRSSRRRPRRGDLNVRDAGAFTKLIEIPIARGVARAAVAPAKKFFLDGKRTSEREFANATVRAPDTDLAEYERAPMQALSGYDVGEVPFVMQAVCYYEETLDVGVLERGLRATLAKYPMLAGRLDLPVRAGGDGRPSRVNVRVASWTSDGRVRQ